MSAGHHRFYDFRDKDPNDKRWVRFNKLVDEALRDPKIKAWLAQPYAVVTTYDMPYLGSSSIGGRHVYLDQHLCAKGSPVGTIYIGNKLTNVRPPLIRHERFEQAVEDVLGLPYLSHDLDDPSAHVLATMYEHRIVPDPKAYEFALRPFVKADEHEKLNRMPGDLDLRPVVSPPVDRKLLARIRLAMDNSKSEHYAADVCYERESPFRDRSCGRCGMFVMPVYGGPSCTGVKDKIEPDGYCKRFARGILGERRKAV